MQVKRKSNNPIARVMPGRKKSIGERVSRRLGRNKNDSKSRWVAIGGTVAAGAVALGSRSKIKSAVAKAVVKRKSKKAVQKPKEDLKAAS